MSTRTTLHWWVVWRRPEVVFHVWREAGSGRIGAEWLVYRRLGPVWKWTLKSGY